MESQYVNYSLDGGIATISMNDGSKNLMSPKMLQELNTALDQAEKDSAVVIITGYDDIFSAGFDLKILKAGGRKALKMLNDGFALTTRMLSFPTPIIIACNGHAVAMGVFLLLSGDFRIGAKGSFKIMANEVAIGMTMPATAIEVCKQRLIPSHFVRAVMQSEEYNPTTALDAGFFDGLVSADHLQQKALEAAQSLIKLDMKAYYNTKLRTRRKLIKALKRANLFDRYDLLFKGIKRLFK